MCESFLPIFQRYGSWLPAASLSKLASTRSCLRNQSSRPISDLVFYDTLALGHLVKALGSVPDRPLTLNHHSLRKYTVEQMFFIGYCFSHCGAEGERLCNVPLKNSDAFAAAFKCAPGSPMNPLVKCNLRWQLDSSAAFSGHPQDKDDVMAPTIVTWLLFTFPKFLCFRHSFFFLDNDSFSIALWVGR